jgi:DNA polymerase-1
MFEVAADAVTATQRRVAKTTNFGIIYGITQHGLAARTDLSIVDAKELIESYFKKYPAIRTYMDDTIKSAHSHGYASTLLGRRRYLPELRARNHTQRQAGERMAINMPIQGTAADIMKIAMIQMDTRLADSGLPIRMILQVHDELLFELPESDVPALAELAREVMEGAYRLSVPLKVDIAAGPTWADLAPV